MHAPSGIRTRYLSLRAPKTEQLLVRVRYLNSAVTALSHPIRVALGGPEQLHYPRRN